MWNLILGKQLHAKSNGLRAAGAQAFGEVLKTNKTLTVVDLSDNEIGVWRESDYPYCVHPTPEGPAALAEGLKANQSVQQLHAQSNGLRAAGAQAIGEMGMLTFRVTTDRLHLASPPLTSTPSPLSSPLSSSARIASPALT